MGQNKRQYFLSTLTPLRLSHQSSVISLHQVPKLAVERYLLLPLVPCCHQMALCDDTVDNRGATRDDSPAHRTRRVDAVEQKQMLRHLVAQFGNLSAVLAAFIVPCPVVGYTLWLECYITQCSPLIILCLISYVSCLHLTCMI